MSEKPNDGWQLGRDSQSKLVVKFTDGNLRTFYSLDWRNKRMPYSNKELGIERLEKLISKWGSKAQWAHIESTQTQTILKRYEYGIEIPLKQ